MIKSAILTSTISRLNGGLFESVRRLNQSLDKQGVSVEVLSCRDQYSDEDIEAWLPLRPQLFDPLPPRAFSYAPGLLPALKEKNVDIVHCHGIWMYQSLANLQHWKKTKVPYLISPHGMLDPWAVQNSRWKKAIAEVLYEKRHLQNAACLRALCRSEAESMRAYGLTNPICVIPNGIDLVERETFPPPPWGDNVAGSKRVLLYLGRIHPKKGLTNLLQAWTALTPSQKKDWVLIIAGWDQGGHEYELKKLSKVLDVEGEVFFPGSMYGEQKTAAYHHADAFILPSFSEGLPMVVLEAWANCLPVVMTPQCNLPEGFASGAAVEVLPEAASIAQGLETVMSMSESERVAIGNNGLELVKSKFMWCKVAYDLKNVYDWLLTGSNDVPDCIYEHH